MKTEINWGILGCGRIANLFALALATVKDTKIVAVASKSSEKATAFAKEFNVPKYYDSYEALCNDPSVDVIYIANTHNFHKETMLLCLKHHKAILCEKAFTLNAADSKEVIDIARKQNVFLMEAMWTRFHPSIIKLKQLLAEGAIGTVQLLKVDFGIATQHGESGRHLNPHLAGGALLDVGIYTITFANIVFGKTPKTIQSSAVIGKTGVDEISNYMFTYDTGEIAMLTSAVTTHIPHTATLYGTKGKITMTDFFHAQEITLQTGTEKEQTLKFPFVCNGYEYEIMEVVDCLRKGKTESEVMSHEVTLNIMETMDTLRGQWGLKYPGE